MSPTSIPHPVRTLLTLAGLLPALTLAPAAGAASGRFDGPRWIPAPADSADFGDVHRRLDAAERIAAAASRDARERMSVRRPLRLAADSAAAALFARLAAARPADSVAMAQALLLRFKSRAPTEGIKDSITREVLWEGFHLLERQLGPDHPGLLPALGHMSNAYHATQNLRRAIETDSRRITLLEALAPVDSLELIGALCRQCEHRALLGEFAGADTDGARAVAIAERLGPAGEGPLARALTMRANAYFRQSRWREALALQSRALAIRERTSGPGSADAGQALHNLAAGYAELGEADSAAMYGERALAVWERPENSANANIGNTLTLLGQLRRQAGDYEAARALLERGLAIRRRASAPESPVVAQALESLAGLLEEMGDYAAALPDREEAVRIRERAQGERAGEYANALEGLARLRVALGDPAAALPLARRAIELRERTLGAGNEQLARMYATLGDAQVALGDPRAALASYEHAHAVGVAAGLDGRADLVPVLLRLGRGRLALGEPARADSVLAAAAALAARTLGGSHPLALEVSEALAHAELDLGRVDAALAHALAAERAGREIFRLQAPGLSERQALRYADVRPSGLPLAIEIATRTGDAARVADVWDGLLAWRGQVLDEMAERRAAVRRTEDAATGSLRADWERASRALGALLASGSAADSAWAPRVAAARERLERAEVRLGEKSRAFRDERARSQAGFAAVARALPAGCALVAFARYSPDARNVAGAHAELAAFVLPARDAKPLAVPLGDAATVDSLCRAWRAEMRAPAPGGEAAALAAGRALRAAAWDPVAARLRGAKRVLVVPEGELNLVNFAALPAADGRYLAESGPEFHLLPGERDVLAAPRASAGHGLLALGGPDFDARADGAGAPLLAAATARTRAPAWRGPTASCAGFRDVRFGPLPASEREIERVAAQWTAAPAEVVRLSGADASEAAVRNLAPGRRIVHLATHGFFVDPRCGAGEGGGRGIGGLAPAGAATATPDGGAGAHAPPALENPLRLAGLALAGANQRASAPAGADDGILTAEELAALDLSAVEWVVLSACDTGVGSVDAGEGVSGLRRALRVAGARTVVSSLWAVEDESALRWMESLYRRHLRLGEDAAASVAGAMRDELARRRAAGESTHPFYWAGFVAAGDWR